MKKLSTTTLIIVVMGITCYAQQDPLYSQYLNNPFVINPAYAGLNNNLNASVAYRSQWGGFDGHPTTLNFNSHISLVDNKVGAGLLVVQDKLGNVKNTDIMGAASYKIKFKEQVFSFGMQAGITNSNSNNNSLNIYQPGDPAFATGDNLSKFNVGVGAILKSDKYFLGFSVPRLLKTKMSNGGQSYELYDQHIYLFGSYIFFINEHLRFKPSTLIKAVKGSPISADLNANLNIDGKYTAGVFTRNFNTYGVLLQANFKDKYRVGYTFEMPTNNSVGTRYTTNELFLGIMLPVLNYHDRSLSSF